MPRKNRNPRKQTNSQSKPTSDLRTHFTGVCNGINGAYLPFNNTTGALYSNISTFSNQSLVGFTADNYLKNYYEQLYYEEYKKTERLNSTICFLNMKLSIVV